MKALVWDCMDEISRGKALYFIAAVTALAILTVLFLSSGEIRFNLQGISMDKVSDLIGNPLIAMIGYYASVLVFFCVIATAGQIPTMLQKGSVDYFLSRPISREKLLMGKLLGMFIAYGGVLLLCLSLLASVTFIKFHFFQWKVLYIVLLQLLIFFLWLSITTFTGVVFRSTVLSIMIAALLWFFQYVLHWSKIMEKIVEGPESFINTLRILYKILPKTSEISSMAYRLALDQPVMDWSPVSSSLMFSAVLLLWAIGILKFKDF